MRTITITAGIAAAALTLAACGSQDTATVHPAVQDHAAYEVEQRRSQAPATTAPPVRTYDAWPGKPADAIDDIFIEHIEDDGINVPRQVAIDAARDGVCFFAGTVDSGEALLMIVIESTGLPMNQAAVFSGAAVAAYCPQHMDIVLNDQVA